MYINGGKQGLHSLVETVIEECVAQILINRCNQLSITLQPENQIRIHDNGPGLPIEVDEKYNKRMLEILMTQSGVDRYADGSYKANQHSFGVLIRAVNALSTDFQVEVARGGYLWQQNYREGKAQTEVIQVRELNADEPTGTTVTFKPDFTIMEQNEFDYELLRQRMYEFAMLLKQAMFTIRDERVQPAVENVYHFEKGLITYLDDLRGKNSPLHFPIAGYMEAKTAKDHYRGGNTLTTDFIFQYVQSNEPQILSYANLVRTVGGTHISGFYAALRKILSEYGYEKGLINRKNGPLTWQQLSRGLIAIIHVLHPDPQHESQTKIKLLNPEVESVVEQAVLEAFQPFAQQHPDVIEQIIRQCLRL
jgi:DNA gyrase subunit B